MMIVMMMIMMMVMFKMGMKHESKRLSARWVTLTPTLFLMFSWLWSRQDVYDVITIALALSLPSQCSSYRAGSQNAIERSWLVTFQVAGNTGSPADRDYVNEAVDYFKNKLRFTNVILLLSPRKKFETHLKWSLMMITIRNIALFCNTTQAPNYHSKFKFLIILGNTGLERRCRSKAFLATARRLHQRLDWFSRSMV